MAATLAQLRTRAKQLADMEGSSFIADAEWLTYLNEGGSELHDLITTKYEDYQVTSQSVTLVVGTAAYALPNDYLKTRGVDLVSGGRSYTLSPFEFRERNRLAFDDCAPVGEAAYQYQVVGSNLRFIPVPSAAGTVTHWYVPAFTALSGDSDTTPATWAAGWERYIVAYAALRAKIKEESDTTVVERELARATALVQAAAGNRDAGAPRRVVDVRRAGWWP